MKKIADFSVKYPVSVAMMVLGIILLGIISVSKLGVDLFPDMNAPRIYVNVKAGERPPEEIEKQFIENIESQIIRQKGVNQVSSICRVGSGLITVEYQWGTDMDEAFLDIQKGLNDFSQNSDIDEITISQQNPNAIPVRVIGLKHESIGDMNELRKVADNYLKNELLRLEGVADVVISGKEEDEVVIETNQYLLDAHGVTTEQIIQQIQNFNRNVSGGSIVELGKKYIIKGVGTLVTLGDFEELVVAYKQEQNSVANTTNASVNQNTSEQIPIFLKDVANIRIENKKPLNIVRLNQERCLGLNIYKETKYNTVKAVEEINESLASIQKALPGYQFVEVQNQGEFIENSINEVQESALLGILFSVFVLFLFLRRIGVTAIISIAIPVSVIATFNLMYFNGLSLNIMTLGGLALGAGMLVDNAIVVVENIFRHIESGKSIKEAAVEGTSEVGGAIVASTLTTIVVFLPIVYLQGASGELFKDQAWTVAFSLLASLFVALLLIPMLVSIFFKKARKQELKTVQITWYGHFLEKVIQRRWLIIALALILIAGSAALIPIVGSEFIPKSESGEFSIEFTLSEGTEIMRTSQTMANVEQLIMENAGDKIETLYSRSGPSSAGSEDKVVVENENTANIKVILNEKGRENPESVIRLVGEIVSQIPDTEARIVRDETALQSIMGTDEAPLVVEVAGKDLDEIESIVNQVRAVLTANSSIYNVKSSVEEGAPEVDVVIDRYRASLYNLDVAGITNQVKNRLMGREAGKFDSEGEQKDITIKVPEMQLYQLRDMTIKAGEISIPLEEVAEIRLTNSPKEILRKNQTRVGKISAQIKKGETFDRVIESVQQELNTLAISPDYRVKITGEEEKRKEAMANLKFALLLSIILVYMVMASQFESLLHPFTILLTIPLAGVGAIVAFFALGITLNMMGFIGIIMLAGIAVNDSIILVDAINKFKRNGYNKIESIVMAGQNRIRPIIMTSLTTILALFPLTIGFGESAALRAPMAVAVIGGLVTSTLLTLVVIPCVYYVIDSVRNTND